MSPIGSVPAIVLYITSFMADNNWFRRQCIVKRLMEDEGIDSEDWNETHLKMKIVESRMRRPGRVQERLLKRAGQADEVGDEGEDSLDRDLA